MLVRENPGKIRVVKWKDVLYQDYINWQSEQVQKRKKSRAVDVVSVLTFSKSVYTTPDDGRPVLIDIEDTIMTAKRGGDDSWHGPGQIVVSPVVKLMEGFHVRDLTNILEAPVRRILEEYGVTPDEHSEDDFPGITVEGRKIAQVGLHLDELVTSYGIAFNVTCDLSKFEAINLCGIENCEVTNLAEETDRPVDLDEVLSLMIKYVEEVFLDEESVPGEGPGDSSDGAGPHPNPKK